MLRILFLLLSSCCFPLLHAQDYSYKHYNTDKGLAGSTVFCIFQDREGFVWFGTQTGVSRFDGSSFRNFTTSEGLVDNEVYRIYGDRKGRIWFSSYNSELCYYYRGHIYNSSSDSTLRGTKVQDIAMGFCEDSLENTWIASRQLYRLRPGRKPEVTGRYMPFLDMRIERDSVLTVGSSGILMRYKEGTIRMLKPPEIRKEAEVYRGALFYKGDLLLYRRNQIHCCGYSHTRAWLKKTYTFEHDIVNLNTDRNNRLWVSTMNGGAWYFSDFPSQELRGPFLKGEFISGVLEDREGNLWFSTVGNGVYLLTSRSALTYNTSHGISSNQALSIHASGNGDVFIAFNRGKINRISPQGITEYTTYGQAFNRVVDIMPDSSGNTWFCSDAGLYVLRKDGRMEQRGRQTSVKSIEMLEDGRVLAGYNFGVVALPAEGPIRGEEMFWDKRATAICRDTNGVLWLGTLEGLYRYSRGVFTYLGAENPLFAKKIICIRRGADGSVWVATGGFGLVCIRGSRIHTISSRDGLASDICKSVFLARNGNVWVATNLGLNRITLHDRARFRFSIQKYNLLDGLASDEVNSVYVKDSTVWVATNNGVTRFSEAELKGTAPPATYITGIRAGQQAVSPDSSLVLEHSRSSIGFSFTGISFYSAGRMRYRYMLAGTGRGWQETAQNTVEYVSLPPGSYSLIVYAQDSKGLWSTQPASFSFTVKPAFWQTKWFSAGSLGLASAGVSLLVLRLVRKARAKEQSKARLAVKMAELELQAVRAQINPHFIFNCLNSIQHYILRHDHQSAQRYLSGFARLIRKTLDFSRDIHVRLSDEIEYLENYLLLERLRFENKFSYLLQVDKDLHTQWLLIPAMLIQPHVENAILHAFNVPDREGLLTISFHAEGNTLVCRVDDDGVGRKEESVHKGSRSHGMSITRSRIDSLNTIFNSSISQEIVDKADSMPGATGTTVILKLPISYDKSSTD
jgi:ligand-binding sensor domain-containing protein